MFIIFSSKVAEKSYQRTATNRKRHVAVRGRAFFARKSQILFV